MKDKQRDQDYRETEYRFVTTDSVEILNIGSPNPSVDHVLKTLGCETLAFITNFNPRGEPYSDAANGRRNEALQRWLRSRGIHYFVGMGMPAPGSNWPPETSFAITGISRTKADNIARQCEQRAYVWHEIGAKSQLIYTDFARPSPEAT